MDNATIKNMNKKVNLEQKGSRYNCPECGNHRLILDEKTGDQICNVCGAVIRERMVDEGPEWRGFSPEERNKRSRVGSPMNVMIHDKGLSTIIGWGNRDIYGRQLSPINRAKMYRLRKWQTRIRFSSSKDRNLTHAMSELDRLGSQMGVPRGVKETSAVIYRKALEKNLSRGRSIEALVGASLYAATRIRRVPRSLDEIAIHSSVSKKELGKCYRVIVKEWDLKIPPASPLDYLSRFGTELQLSGMCQRRAADILIEAQNEGLTSGKDPTGLAAAAIYLAGIIKDERRTQREIAATAQVTEVTVRNRYKELVRELELDISN
ncbi:MAG: transcription initiation factor IIB [Candidatus Hodarchaeota archaeon]